MVQAWDTLIGPTIVALVAIGAFLSIRWVNRRLLEASSTPAALEQSRMAAVAQSDENRLAIPELRRWLVVILAIGIVLFVAAAAAFKDLDGRLIFGALAAWVMLFGTAGVTQERRITRDFETAVANVLEYHPRPRRKVRITYAFRTSSGQTVRGSSGGNVRSLTVGNSVAVAYNRTSPRWNLPLRNFLFYRFRPPADEMPRDERLP